MGKLWLNQGKLILGASGELVLCGDCPCEAHTGTGTGTLIPPRILLWDTNCTPVYAGSLDDVKAVYAANGATADRAAEWTGDLHSYGLVIWILAESDPSWWSLVSGGSWAGRILVTGEFFNFFSNNSNNYVNGKSALHGMTLGADNSAPFGTTCSGETATAAAHQLTDGVTSLAHGATNSVSGGNTLFTNTSLGKPMMQQKKSAAGIDWVVSGDSNPFHDACPATVAAATRFLLNLWGKPIP